MHQTDPGTLLFDSLCCLLFNFTLTICANILAELILKCYILSARLFSCFVRLPLRLSPLIPRSSHTFFHPHHVSASFLAPLRPSVCPFCTAPLAWCCFSLQSLLSSLFFPPPLSTWQTVGTLFVPVAGVLLYGCKGFYLTFYYNNIHNQPKEYYLG